ncbi:MAG TPA: alkaline phosphatase family protein [Gemmatimonadaceae bacterium]|nr:alkaline phosphatase family protein [Gemmatimonadaceae bacterium]
MPRHHLVRRVIVVVLDGLRSDAIAAFDLSTVRGLAQRGAHTLAAHTVAPSVTAAAMGSLLTGVSPDRHGLTSDRFHIPRSRGPVSPLPSLLDEAGYVTTACMAEVPMLYRRIARGLARRLGVQRPSFAGAGADEILRGARPWLTSQRSGLLLFHWPDADRAGHAAGWMSPAYGAAARGLDAALGRLVQWTSVESDPTTLLIALADHGGGGVDPKNHDSAHPADRTIPIVMAGGAVAAGRRLAPGTSILDVPATVLWALGVAPPPVYEGRALVEAFDGKLAAAGAGAAA